MKESKICLDYIDKIKKVIDKIKQIELIFSKIKMEELNGGGQITKNKLEKYKKEILKLREIRNKYLMELEMYKEKIKVLSYQNQYFYKKISELSFVNYINHTEKNNLVDKLDFFNKSLDTLQSSILTNVNAGNELLERFNTKTKMNGENKISNVNITITNKDLEGEGFTKPVSFLGGSDEKDLEKENNNILVDQSGGYELGRFKRENKIGKVTAELQNKITLMRTITVGVRRIIENIIRNINDQNNNNSLLNIRIKLEWIMNKFRELSEDNEEAKNLLGVLEDVKTGLDGNITDMGVFENLLNKVKTDTGNFIKDAGEITKTLVGVDDVLASRANNNQIIQGGGYDNETEINNLIKLVNIYQRGGVENDRQYYDFNTITSWLDFFANCQGWPDSLKYKFNIIRTNYYMTKQVLELIEKTFVFGDENTNPLYTLIPIVEKNKNNFIYISEENISDVFKEDFEKNNSSDGIKEKTEEIKKELPVDLDSLMLAFLLENNSDNAVSDKLEKYEKYFLNMNNNLTELLYSSNFFKGLSYAFKIVEPTESGIGIDDLEVLETEKIFNSLKKLAYQTELFKDPAEFITLKSNLLQTAFTRLYWQPFEKFLSIYNSLDKDLQDDIDIIETNIKDFILGMKYSSNQSQVHSIFYNIDLNNKKSSSSNITDYDSTFLYINMLKRALYIKDNSDFKDIFNAIINSKSKNLDLKITKANIIMFSKLPEASIPELKPEMTGGNPKLKGGNPKLKGGNPKLKGGNPKLIGGVEALTLSPEEARAKLIENAKTAFNNVNRSKVTDMFSMIDNIVDGFKLENFSKIKNYIKNLATQIDTKEKSGAFSGKELKLDSIMHNIDNTIKGKKELDIEKEKLRLILENIKKDDGRKIIKDNKDSLDIKLTSIDGEISTLDGNFTAQKNKVKDLIKRIIELYTKIISSSDLQTINRLREEKKNLAKEYKKEFKTFYSSSKNKIKLINDKGYLLEFKEFVKSQEKNYDDTQVNNVNIKDIIKILESLDTTNEEKFNDGKSQIKIDLRNLIKTSDDAEYLQKYELFKKLNIQLIYSIDKIVTESSNAIIVYVKARMEGNKESDRYTYTNSCIIVKEKEGAPLNFGMFKNIFWSNRTISDLYCGKDINCNDKVPLTNSVRDSILTGTRSVIIFTYGPSGSGKTKILTGIPYGNVEGDKKGIIARIMEDVLEEIDISSSGTEIAIECMIGEIYGEKYNLSLLDNRYTERLIMWNLSTLEEREYISDIKQEEKVAGEYEQFIDKLQFLEDLKKSQYTTSDRKFNISISEKLELWRSTHEMKNEFNPDPKYLEKYLNLEGYTKSPSELAEYNNIYKIIGSSKEDESTLYTKFLEEEEYKKFSEIITDPKDISKFSQEVSIKFEEIIDKIQAIRREENRVRCTKYNPDSSRSHMFFIFRVIDKVTGKYKYYIIIDKAGSEIPYEIAASEFVRLAPDLNEKDISFYKINYATDTITGVPGQNDEKDIELMKDKLDVVKIISLQIIKEGDFIKKTSISYRNTANPSIELFFSENFKIIITTKYKEVSKVEKISKIVSGNTKSLIKIKELLLSLNIKIINSGVNQEFNYVMNHDVSEVENELNIDLSLLIKILREKKADESIIRDIIANIKSSIIKKNMPLLLFSGISETNTNLFDTVTQNINKSISTLTNNLMNILNLLNKQISIPGNSLLDVSSKKIFDDFYGKVDEQFLTYSITNLTSLPEITNVSIKLTKDGNETDFIVIQPSNEIDIIPFKTKLDNNINNFKLYLNKLKTVDSKNSDKINLLIDSIKESIPSEGINTDILDNLTQEEYDNILDTIQKGIEIIKKAYLFINLNKKIEEHKSENRSSLITKYSSASDKEKNNIRFTYESNFIKSLFEQVIEKSFISSVDRTLPTTKDLDIDYRNLLASYFIQRSYFSKLKQGTIGCNSQVIIDVTTKITEAIRFIFDSFQKNPITKSFINKEYIVDEPVDFTINEVMDKNNLFDKDEKIKRDVGKWENKAINSGTKPETLAELSKILDELKINYKHLNSIDEIKLKKEPFTFYIKKKLSTEEPSPSDEEIKISVRNLLKQLYLISKLDNILRFFNFIDNTSTKIIDLRSDTSIIANFDEILWKDNDKVTYMIEYERLFNITSLFVLDESSPKFKELNEAKNEWTIADKYGLIWENVANNIIPIYLLNVRQGFWINHSIRTLMRNIMYTADKDWVYKQIFDVSESIKNKSLNALDPNKRATAGLLLENIYSLKEYLEKNKNDRENISNRIFSNKDTLEQVYLAPYDISKSPWLKLLGSIYHLGSDNHPTDINIKLPKGVNSSKKKWTGTNVTTEFVTLNESLFRTSELAEQFITNISQDSDYPDFFDFSDKMFLEITKDKNAASFLNKEEDIKNLRLPWNVKELNGDEVKKIKNFFVKDPKFEKLFKYTIGDEKSEKEITFEEIDRINKILEKNNVLLKEPIENEDFKTFNKKITGKINTYKGKVSKFKENIESKNASNIEIAKSQFDFDAIELPPPPQAGGDYRNQFGGADYTEEEKQELIKLIKEAETPFPNEKLSDIIEAQKLKYSSRNPDKTALTDKQAEILGRKNMNEAPFTKIIGKIRNLVDDLSYKDIDKINYLFGENGIVKKILTNNSINKLNIVSNSFVNLTAVVDALETKIGHFDNDKKNIYITSSKTTEPQTLSGTTGFCEEITKIIDKIMTSDSFNESDKNNFKSITELILSVELIYDFFKKLATSGDILVLKEIFPKEFRIMNENIVFIEETIKKIKEKMNGPEINQQFFDLYIKENEQNIKIINARIEASKKKNIDDSIAERDNIISEIDELIKKNNDLTSYVEKSGPKINDNRQIIIFKTCQYILIILELNQNYLERIKNSIIIDPNNPIQTFNNISKYLVTINKINEQNLDFKENKLFSLIQKLNAENKLNIEGRLEKIPDNFTEINQNKIKYEIESKKEEDNNTTLVTELNNKFKKEVNVKGQLDISLTERAKYLDEYQNLKSQFGETWWKEGKENFNFTPNRLESGLEGFPKAIVLITPPEANKKTNLLEASEIIIKEIQEYIDKNGIYPEEKDSVAFTALAISIYKKIKNLIFNNISQTNINIIHKIQFAEKKKFYEEHQFTEKKKFYEELMDHKELIDYKPNEVLSKEIKKILNINTETPEEILVKINEKKNVFYQTYFKDPNAGSGRQLANRFGAARFTGAYVFKDDEKKKIDDLVSMLSNLYYIEDFDYIKDKDENPINEICYKIDPNIKKGVETNVIELIKLILKNNNYKRENKMQDPLEGKSLDNVTIAELKASKQIQSINSIVKNFNISKSVILLLALSTSEYKVGLCIVALKFANLLTQITNPPCSNEITQSGGNIKKKYKLSKINNKCIDI